MPDKDEDTPVMYVKVTPEQAKKFEETIWAHCGGPPIPIMAHDESTQIKVVNMDHDDRAWKEFVKTCRT